MLETLFAWKPSLEKEHRGISSAPSWNPFNFVLNDAIAPYPELTESLSAYIKKLEEEGNTVTINLDTMMLWIQSFF
jgi:hypothetical protein